MSHLNTNVIIVIMMERDDEDEYHVDGEGKSMQILQRCSYLQARLVCDHSLTVKIQGLCRGVSSPCSSHSWHLHRRRMSLIFRPDLNHYNHDDRYIYLKMLTLRW